MKRSIAKKTEKQAIKDQVQEPLEDSAWFDVMRATLSPYWSARLEYTSDRATHSDDKDKAA